MRGVIIRLAVPALLAIGLLVPANASAASTAPNGVPGQNRCLVVTISVQGNSFHVATITLSIRNLCGDEASGNWSFVVTPTSCSDTVVNRTQTGRFDIPDGQTNSWGGTAYCVNVGTGETLPWSGSFSAAATGRTFTSNQSVGGSGSTSGSF